MSEKPEGNGPPPPLPETLARPSTPTEATTHSTPLSNGVRLSTVQPAQPPRVASAMPLMQTAGAAPPPPPPPPPPSDLPIVKTEPAIISESAETDSQSGQTQEICRDFIRGSCSRESKCRYLHEYDQKQVKELLVFCHDFQNKECVRPNCKFVHATITEEQNFYKTGKLPKAILEKNRNGEAQPCPQPTTIDLNNLITRPPPPPSATNPVSCNPRAPTHFKQGPRDVFPTPANLSMPPPTVRKWNYIRPNGRPKIQLPPPTENFIQPPTHNPPLMSYFPSINQPPPTAVMKDNSWPTPSQLPPIKTDIRAADKTIGIKRAWPDTGDNLNVSRSLSPGHKAMRMDFMGSCSNCKLLESRIATAESEKEELLKIILEFEKYQKEAEKQKSLLEHISSIIGSSQTQNHMPLGDNVPNISNTLLNLGLPVTSLCAPHTQIQSGLDSQQITMQLPSLQIPQLLHLQRNHSSNDQQVRISNPTSIIGNCQNWSDPSLNGQQQSMVSLAYGNNQVMLQVPPGRQLTPQQQQILQLLDTNGFNISYK